MSNLATLAPGLKRELAVPGEFDTFYPNTLDTDLVGSLADAFAKAQLDGYFGTQVLDPIANTVLPDLSAAGGALLGVYAAEAILMSKVRFMATRSVYEAAGVKYEKDQSANVLVQELRMLQLRKEHILAQALRLARAAGGGFAMTDAYLNRAMVPSWYANYATLELGIWGGFYPYELSW